MISSQMLKGTLEGRVLLIISRRETYDYICKNSFKPNKALFILGLTAIIAVCIVAGIPVPSVTLVQMHIGVSVLVPAVLAVVYFIINSKLA